jgi:hypothetical protein
MPYINLLKVKSLLNQILEEVVRFRTQGVHIQFFNFLSHSQRDQIFFLLYPYPDYDIIIPVW